MCVYDIELWLCCVVNVFIESVEEYVILTWKRQRLDVFIWHLYTHMNFDTVELSFL